MKKNYKAFIFDMDGVLRCGDQGIDGADKIVKLFENKQIPTLILTNECRFTKNKIIKDLELMGINIPENWDIYTSADCAKDFICQVQKVDYIYVLGEGGLKDTLKENPIIEKKITKKLPSKNLSWNTDLMIVIGALNKIKDDEIDEAVKWIRCGAKIITTCFDVCDPGSKGENPILMLSHIFHIIKQIIPCTSYSIGKPNPIMTRKALEIIRKKDQEIKLDEILFIGDSLDTDIKCAFELGLDSALVLTGNTRMHMIKGSIIQPDYIFHSVKEIYDEINKD